MLIWLAACRVMQELGVLTGESRTSQAQLAGPQNSSVLALSCGDQEQAAAGWCYLPPGLALGLLWKGFCYLEAMTFYKYVT